MDALETIKLLCAKNGTNISNLEKELGYGNGSLSKAKKIPSDRILDIAKYFNVSMEYIMTGVKKQWEPTLSDKDERELDIKVDKLLNAVISDTGLMLDGKIMDEETREIFAMNLRNALKTTKLAAKAKYTPKKYKK